MVSGHRRRRMDRMAMIRRKIGKWLAWGGALAVALLLIVLTLLGYANLYFQGRP